MPRRVLVLLSALCVLALGSAPALADTTTSGPAPAPTATTATTSALAPPTTPPATVYGIGDSMGAFAGCAPDTANCCDADTATCTPAQTTGFFADRTFQRLLTPASQHRVTEVRLFVTYDALQEWNGSTSAPGCVYSRALMQPWTDAAGRLHDAGQSWRDLLAGLIEARAEGLTPVVAISGYGSPHAMPGWDAPAPDPTTLGGWWEYHCGVQGILDAVAKLPSWQQPHLWEALNEPDGFDVFRSFDGRQATGCDPAGPVQPDGAAKAACAYAEVAAEIHQFADHGGDEVLAGTFIRPDVDYLRSYVAALARIDPGAAFPAGWSVHDYADVTAAYAGPIAAQLAAFDAALATLSGGRARELWITEAGTLLTDAHRGGGCPGVGPDASGTLGACVDGQAERQARTAAAFFALPETAGTAVPVTHLFWYQWQSSVNWDSGLVDEAGAPRVAWCVFYGSGSCVGDPDAPSS